MENRMSKYENSETIQQTTRVAKNAELYKTINKGELENYEIKSNATILGSNSKNEIDVDKIKKILDNKYNEPKRRSIRVEDSDEEELLIVETTKEYDINAILEKARGEKEETYQEEKAKKMRDTQFDILNNLKLDQEEVSEENLVNLINTITINETKVKENATSVDLLDDLKGDEDTQVIPPMKEDITSTDTFTTTSAFEDKDFLKDEDSEKAGKGLKIFLIIILIAFLVGVFIFLKSVLNF